MPLVVWGRGWDFSVGGKVAELTVGGGTDGES
jgi:hypothetical protein